MYDIEKKFVSYYFNKETANVICPSFPPLLHDWLTFTFAEKNKTPPSKKKKMET